VKLARSEIVAAAMAFAVLEGTKPGAAAGFKSAMDSKKNYVQCKIKTINEGKVSFFDSMDSFLYLWFIIHFFL
jgi:hypothetical protein